MCILAIPFVCEHAAYPECYPETVLIRVAQEDMDRLRAAVVEDCNSLRREATNREFYRLERLYGFCRWTIEDEGLEDYALEFKAKPLTEREKLLVLSQSEERAIEELLTP